MEVIIAGHIPDERVQSLTDHLDGTMRLAEGFGAGMGLGAEAGLWGKIHDEGKDTAAFQDYIHGRKHRRVDHSTAGAKSFLKMRYRLAAAAGGILRGGAPCRNSRLWKQSRYCRDIYATRAYEKRYPFRPTSGTLLYG